MERLIDLRILKSIKAGKGNKEISEEIGTGIHNVNRYIAEYRKLGYITGERRDRRLNSPILDKAIESIETGPNKRNKYTFDELAMLAGGDSIEVSNTEPELVGNSYNLFKDTRTLARIEKILSFVEPNDSKEVKDAAKELCAALVKSNLKI